jgi:hypothetical protein
MDPTPSSRPERRKRAFIIHGYLSYPAEAWLPWMKAELEKRGYRVELPAMPAPDRPVIAEWVRFIDGLVGAPDGDTVIVGHSMGVMAVIFYLESIGRAGRSVGRTVLVAGGFPPGLSAAEAAPRIHGNSVLTPWFTTPVDPAKVRAAAGKATVIISNDDPYIDVPKAVAAFEAKLGPAIIRENGKGHYNEDDGLTELPAALEAAIAAG